MAHYRFYSVDSNLTHRNAQKVQIVREITDPEEGFDAEVLPMVEVKFGDGYVTEVWPDELKEFTAYAAPTNAYGSNSYPRGGDL